MNASIAVSKFGTEPDQDLMVAQGIAKDILVFVSLLQDAKDNAANLSKQARDMPGFIAIPQRSFDQIESLAERLGERAESLVERFGFVDRLTGEGRRMIVTSQSIASNDAAPLLPTYVAAAAIARRDGISRQAVSRHIARLVADHDLDVIRARAGHVTGVSLAHYDALMKGRPPTRPLSGPVDGTWRALLASHDAANDGDDEAVADATFSRLRDFEDEVLAIEAPSPEQIALQAAIALSRLNTKSVQAEEAVRVALANAAALAGGAP